jgi:hypothetical protein
VAGFDLPSWIESVAAGARNPLNWLASADRLKRASDQLREVWLDDLGDLFSGFEEVVRRAMAGDPRPFRESVGPVSMLLAGFALENALKGVLIAREPDRFVQPKARKPDRIVDWGRRRGHDLAWLASEARLSVTEEERRALEKLTVFIDWAGRYPVALWASEMAPSAEGESAGYFSSEVFPIVDSLFERARSLLETEATERARLDAEVRAGLRRERCREALRAIAGLCQERMEGVTLFRTDLPSEPGSLVVCVECKASVSLDPSTPAALCRCGRLAYAEKRPVAGRAEIAVEHFESHEVEQARSEV